MYRRVYKYMFILLLLNFNLSTATKHNVLFIIVDDFRPPDDEVFLPNVQKLSEKGATFKNAFAQQALCAPSRNSMLTGRRPDALLLYDVNSYWRTAVGNFSTLPQYFKQNGYVTYSVGKVFHPGISSNHSDDYPYSWSYEPLHPSTEKYRNYPVCSIPWSKHDFTHSCLNCPVHVKDQPERTLPDLQSLEYAGKIIKDHDRKQPFFLAVGFHKPHIPLKYPRRYLGKVPTVHPPKHPNRPINLPTVAWQPWMDVRQRYDIHRLAIDFPFGIMPMNMTMRIRRNYYAASLYIDDIIGQLLKHVDFKNTIVVLTSDHGWSLGENGLWAKYSNFDVALRVPLIIASPSLQPRTISDPVELIDIFPTLVKLADLPDEILKCNGTSDKSQLCFEGKSLLNIMLKETQDNYVALSQYPRPSSFPQSNTEQPKLKDIKIMGYSLRTKRYRYTEWIGFNTIALEQFKRDWSRKYGEELYDHIIDTDEANNLSENTKYEAIKIHLSKLLRYMVESEGAGFLNLINSSSVNI